MTLAISYDYLLNKSKCSPDSLIVNHAAAQPYPVSMLRLYLSLGDLTLK